jgi:pyruvate/2-oxoglutarate/acetoin dehydrogenase E1 component
MRAGSPSTDLTVVAWGNTVEKSQEAMAQLGNVSIG